MQTGIGIGLPFGGRLVHHKWAMSFYILDFPLNTSKRLLMVENRPIDEARNLIVDMAKDNECKFLYFLDDDVVTPRYTVLALGNILEKHKDDGVMVATGIYCTKSFVPYPVIFKDGYSGNYLDWNVNEEFEVDACGAGCMMINMELFEHLEKPYFKFTQDFVEDQGVIGASEDVNFCRAVKKAGFKIMAHGAVLCAHYCNEQNKFYALPEDSPPFRREKERQQKEAEREKQEV